MLYLERELISYAHKLTQSPWVSIQRKTTAILYSKTHTISLLGYWYDLYFNVHEALNST